LLHWQRPTGRSQLFGLDQFAASAKPLCQAERWDEAALQMRL
jgi:hypothetical protein